MEKSPEQIQSENLFKKICRKMGTTMRDHSLISEGDHILVGLSGGKDSMILLLFQHPGDVSDNIVTLGEKGANRKLK